MPIPSPRPIFLLLLLSGVAICSAARVQRLQLPVPTSETIPYVAKEMGAATYEETIETDDTVPASSKKRIQRKLVTGIEDINGNSEYTEYQGVMGRPGVDFPVLPSIPLTDFSCRNIKSSGYYADLDTDCQVFHICDGGRKISFLCPNGTIFRQSHLICDWWFRVDCGRSVELYEESAEQLAADQKVYKERAEAIARAMQRGSQIEQAKAEPSVKSFSTTPSPRESFRNQQSEFSGFRSAPFNGNSNQQKNKFSAGQNVNYNTERRNNNNNYQQIQRRRPQNNFNNHQSSEFQGQKNYPQYTNSANIRTNVPQRQDEERQQLAETASFASNRNRFGNHFYQQNYYKQSTQPTPVNSGKFPSNNKVYVELNRNAQQPTQFPKITTTLFPQRGPQNQFFDNVASSIYRRPSQQNNFRGNFATSTSPTTIRQNYQNNFAFRSQRPQKQFVQSNFDRGFQQRPLEGIRASSTTQKPIFTLKFKPNKAFSYVELHRARTPAVTPAPAVTAASSAIPEVSSHTEEKSHSPSTVDVTSSTQTSLSTDSSSPVPGLSTQSNKVTSTLTDDISTVLQNITPTNSPSPATSQTPSSITVSNIPLSSVVVSNYENFPSTTENSVYSSSTEFSTQSTPFGQRNVENLGSTSESRTSAASISNYVTPSVTQNPDTDFMYNVSETIQTNFEEIKPDNINSLNRDAIAKNIRHGLKIPTSSGPKALHSLSLYYATSESDVGITTEYATTEQYTEKVSVSELLLRSPSGSVESELGIKDAEPTPDSKVAEKDISAVLTKATKDSYNFLFGGINATDSQNGETTAELNDETFEQSFLLKDHNTNDLDSEQSRGIVQPTTTQAATTIVDGLPDEKKLRDSTDLRELAQVFSRALSAYLEDPDSFRRVLSEVRPTEPTTLGTESTTLLSSEDNEDEVLDFSDVSNSSPSRTAPTSALAYDTQDSITNNGIINEINSLVHQQNDTYTSDISFPVTSPADTTYPPQTTQFTTGFPTSIASDVNYFLSFTNNSYESEPNTFSQTSIDNSYFPTAGGVNDGSRPRYGGFQNNSNPESTTHYSPYGSEVAANLTGLPIHETYPTLPTDSVIPTENSQDTTSEPRPDKANSVLDNNPVPDHIIDAQHVNALQENQNIFSTSAPSGHYITSSDIFTKSTQNGLDLFSPTVDQEKLLIASGSQSIVSKDNIIKYVNYKQADGKNIENNFDIGGIDFNENHEDFGRHLQSSQVTAGTFGNRERVSHGVTFQSVNLGNGVTIERTKTIRYTTPPDSFWTIPPILNENTELTPLSLNNELISLKDDTSAAVVTPYFDPESVQVTTYHPLISQPEVNQPAIPPRSSQNSTWQWSVEPNSTIAATTVTGEATQEDYTTTLKDFQTFPTAAGNEVPNLSTLLPDINTTNFESKAKEMFGNLNETTAKTIMDMISEAEFNMPLRRLILLLVAANGQDNASPEESRAQLIQALLKVPEDDLAPTTIDYEAKESVQSTSRTGKNRGTPMTVVQSTTTIPKQSVNRSRGTKTFRDTYTDTALVSSLRRPVARLQSEVDRARSQSQILDPESDTRAVELLKSLYNLAARWG